MRTPATIFENHLPRRVVTGRAAARTLATLCGDRGWRRVAVCSDPGVVAAGILPRVLEPLHQAGLVADVLTDIPAEPPLAAVDALAARIVDCSADVVVAVGGGSVMDAAKVAAVSARHGRPVADFVGIGRTGGRGLPTVLVPTTAGTGSEATFVAILTDAASGMKVGVVDPHLLADVAVVDPELTDGLPAEITAATGMDAVVHAIEGFIATVSTPLARGLAIEAARQLGGGLEAACRDGRDTAARDRMAVGAHLAGMAFANSSCCAVHALAMPLGGRFHIPHGVITGCFAAAVMRHNAPACAADFATLGEALGWGRTPAAEFADRLDALAGRIGLVAQLRRVCVPDDAITALARDAVAVRRLMDPNPRPVTEADAVRIYRAVLAPAGA
jgi:alcohol dehydrogenase class IV